MSRRIATGDVLSRMKRLRDRCPTCRTFVITCFAFSYLYAYLFLESNSDIHVSWESKVEKNILFNNETSTLEKDIHFDNEKKSLYELHLAEIRKEAFEVARVYQPVSY